MERSTRMTDKAPPAELEGGLARNLQGALASAQRLRGRPVYPETLEFWRGVLAQARFELEGSWQRGDAALERLADALEAELAERV